ncbi:MAG: L,D-transpeptidase [Chloroflexota bacterium]
MKHPHSLSRRSFLKLSTSALAALALPALPMPDDPALIPQPRLGRVTLEMIAAHGSPTSASVRKAWIPRDRVIELLEDAESMDLSLRNKRWYRTAKGYVHSAYVQPVLQVNNVPRSSLPQARVLGEITHPYAQSYRYTSSRGWKKLYRLYYGSLHWVIGFDHLDTGQAAYRIYDFQLNTDYFVPATAVRLIDPAEYAPRVPDVHPSEKRIVVSIRNQTLTAYEGERIVLTSLVSTGRSTRQKEGAIPTETPIGDFRIRKKCPNVHMGNGNLTSDILAYELPGVPWVMFFDPNGVALHGTYWHDNFGVRMSHGCVNLPNDVARWLYRWTDPICGENWYTTGEGTHVHVEV